MKKRAAPVFQQTVSLPPLVLGTAASALGKKNWLFVGAAHAGERGAILYTIVESCRRRGIDPQACLRDVLTHLPKMTTSQIPEVTPEAWNKARRQGHAPQAAA